MILKLLYLSILMLPAMAGSVGFLYFTFYNSQDWADGFHAGFKEGWDDGFHAGFRDGCDNSYKKNKKK